MPTDAELLKHFETLFDELFPTMRSITGPGIEASIEVFRRYMSLEVEKVPTGSEIFDWVVPPEWHLTSARLTGPDGEVVADAAVNNLHVVNYSESVSQTLSLEALQSHLHSLPDLPEAIPYVTSYYRRTWGFCLTERARQALKPGPYRVEIVSEFVDGGVPFAHGTLAGESKQEVMLSSYLCHPSMANNELSGPLVLLGLYLRLQKWERRRFTYRFLLNPETIGALAFLSRHVEHLAEHLRAGLVLTCMGGPGGRLSYKQSRRGTSSLDRLINHVTGVEARDLHVRPFDPTGGSDERQYCAPGFNLPIGQMARTVYGEFPEYHTSLDDRAFVRLASLVDAVNQIEQLLLEHELAGPFVSTVPFGEPQLGRRGLYPTMNSPATRSHSSDDKVDARAALNRMLYALNYADGERYYTDAAAALGAPILGMRGPVEVLESGGLIHLAAPGEKCASYS